MQTFDIQCLTIEKYSNQRISKSKQKKKRFGFFYSCQKTMTKTSVSLHWHDNHHRSMNDTISLLFDRSINVILKAKLTGEKTSPHWFYLFSLFRWISDKMIKILITDDLHWWSIQFYCTNLKKSDYVALRSRYESSQWWKSTSSFLPRHDVKWSRINPNLVCWISHHINRNKNILKEKQEEDRSNEKIQGIWKLPNENEQVKYVTKFI